MDHALDKTNLHDRIVDSLGARIVSASFDAGVLPAEPILAAELGVSRNALREGVKVLARKGLVEARPRTGTKIRPRGDWNLLDPDVLRWSQMAGSSLYHAMSIVEFRLIVEPKASFLAAKRATRDELQAVDETCSRLEGCLGMPLEKMSEFDIAFHRSVLQASHNEILIYLGSIVSGLIKLQVVTTSQDPGALEIGLTQHRALADAILARDAERAEALSIALVRDPYRLVADRLAIPDDHQLLSQRDLHDAARRKTA